MRRPPKRKGHISTNNPPVVRGGSAKIPAPSGAVGDGIGTKSAALLDGDGTGGSDGSAVSPITAPGSVPAAIGEPSIPSPGPSVGATLGTLTPESMTYAAAYSSAVPSIRTRTTCCPGSRSPSGGRNRTVAAQLASRLTTPTAVPSQSITAGMPGTQS